MKTELARESQRQRSLARTARAQHDDELAALHVDLEQPPAALALAQQAQAGACMRAGGAK